MNERRLAMINIDRRYIMDFITGVDVVVMKDGTTRKVTGIPEGVKLEQVHYDPSYDSLRFVLSHPDFPVVPDACMIAHPMITSTDHCSRHLHYHLTEDDSEL